MITQEEKNLKCQFASDNYSGICPEAFEAMNEANKGFVSSYGDDKWTAIAADSIRELFETDCEIFFVFNGTAANSLALASMCQSYHSVICHEYAHIHTDECGGPEFFSNGTKLLTVGGENAKINPLEAERVFNKRNDIHSPRPKVISVTQTTELGTIYTIPELLAIRDFKEKHDLKMHMDGARFANAAAALELKPSEITWKVGVDVLCFGGTKNGMAVGEAVVFFNKELAYEFDYRCKQAGQLASKMRFLAAPWVSMLQSGAWLKNARYANNIAKILSSRLEEIKGIEIVCPTEANAVFVRMTKQTEDAMHNRGWKFYNFIGNGVARFMGSWAVTEEDVNALVSDFKEVIN